MGHWRKLAYHWTLVVQTHVQGSAVLLLIVVEFPDCDGLVQAGCTEGTKALS